MSKNGHARNNISKKYLSDPQRFAEVCNNTLFDSHPVIEPSGLQELDTGELKIVGIGMKELQSVQKERDILKLYRNQFVCALFGIENQSNHYCMPLRCMVYDALNYEEQRRQIKKYHDRQKDLREDEFISGFAKTDRLIPVFTIVVYYGSEPWDGPCTLHEMLDLPKQLSCYKEKLADYQMNLLDINHMENLEQYTGELKAFFGFLKYRADRAGLDAFVQENRDIFNELSYESLQAISIMGEVEDLQEYFGTMEADTTDGKETVDMCKGWEDIKEFCRQEGMQKGIQQGISTLIRDNLDEGVTAERIIFKLQKYFSLTEEESLEYIRQYEQ